MRIILVLPLLILLTTHAAVSACMGKFTSATALGPIVYNPFSPYDERQNINLQVQNTGTDQCAFQLAVPNNYLPLQFAPDLRFAISVPGNGGTQTAMYATTPFLKPTQSFYLHIVIVVFRGQHMTAGVLTKAIGFVLTPTGGQNAVDEVQVLLQCSIPQVFGINLAGAGTKTSIELGGGSNAKKSVVLQTRATQTHRLEVQATAGYLLREGSTPDETSTIPFTLAIDEQSYSLTENAILRITGAPGKASRLLTVAIGDTSRKMAGTYKAVITIRIAANM
jgi:hypothetical protein